MSAISTSAASAKACAIASAWAIRHQPMLVCPVDPSAGKDGKKKRGDLAGKPDHAQRQRRMRQAIGQPHFARLLDPGADERKALPDKEKTVVAVPQGAKKGKEATLHGPFSGNRRRGD